MNDVCSFTGIVQAYLEQHDVQLHYFVTHFVFHQVFVVNQPLDNLIVIKFD
jgi:hypothetical protein